MIGLTWDIVGGLRATALSQIHDDEWPFEYRFRKEAGMWVNETESELVIGPAPASFHTLEAAKQWALRTEVRNVRMAE